jgi:hypothetical protein
MSLKPSVPPAGEYDEVIAQALATEGGHLAIGRGGYTIWFARGSRQPGYDCETIKAAAIAAGLPVIDSRRVAFDIVARLAMSGPMIAVGEPASLPPYGAFAYAPLAYVAQAYREAGAEVFNSGLVEKTKP